MKQLAKSGEKQDRYELRPQVPDSCSIVPSNFTYKTNSKIKLLKNFKMVTTES